MIKKKGLWQNVRHGSRMSLVLWQ